jgi:antitoxin YefM
VAALFHIRAGSPYPAYTILVPTLAWECNTRTLRVRFEFAQTSLSLLISLEAIKINKISTGKFMVKTISISKARKELSSLPRLLSKNPGAVVVTRRGKPVLAILPWELYESIVEILEILNDKKLMASLRKSIREIQAGRVFSSDEVKMKLGL